MAVGDSEDLHRSIEAIQGLLQTLKAGEFSEKLSKVSVYIGSIEKSQKAYASALDSALKQPDQEKRRKAVESGIRGFKASAESSARFARMNLNQAMDQALEMLVRRPAKVNKVDERRKIEALLRWFDGVQDPTASMMEHFKASSDPLDKYLVAGPWGHEYLRKRGINSEALDRELCEALKCPDSASSRLVLGYGNLNRAIDDVESEALKALEAFGA